MHTDFDKDKENDLIHRCLLHDRAAQELLYRSHADEMYNVALLYTENDDDACDVLQDAFIKVFRRLDSFKSDCPLRHWIRRIVVNTALDLYRKKKREREHETEYQQTAVYEVDDIVSSLNATDIVRFVERLPSKAAMVLKLYILEGYPHKDIAEMLQISEGTSKSQLNRARNLLKEMIVQHGGV